MRILLVQPPKSPVAIGGEDVYIYEPLALEYLAAVVAAAHEERGERCPNLPKMWQYLRRTAQTQAARTVGNYEKSKRKCAARHGG
jgi:hypothetical protein